MKQPPLSMLTKQTALSTKFFYAAGFSLLAGFVLGTLFAVFNWNSVNESGLGAGILFLGTAYPLILFCVIAGSAIRLYEIFRSSEPRSRRGSEIFRICAALLIGVYAAVSFFSDPSLYEMMSAGPTLFFQALGI